MIWLSGRKIINILFGVKLEKEKVELPEISHHNKINWEENNLGRCSTRFFGKYLYPHPLLGKGGNNPISRTQTNKKLCATPKKKQKKKKKKKA